MGILKKTAVFSLILPLLLLTLSFCCLKMMTNAHAVDCYSSMASSSDTVQHGLNSHSIANVPPSFNRHCEQLAESYGKAGLKSVDSYKSNFNNPKAIIFASQTFAHSALALPFFNYQAPPKIVQNSLPLYLQFSVLRI